MHGSFRENSAQDLDLKLMPWKHAKDILTPCKSIFPPKTVPQCGKGYFNVDKRNPDTTSNARCQWR